MVDVPTVSGMVSIGMNVESILRRRNIPTTSLIPWLDPVAVATILSHKLASVGSPISGPCQRGEEALTMAVRSHTGVASRCVVLTGVGSIHGGTSAVACMLNR